MSTIQNNKVAEYYHRRDALIKQYREQAESDSPNVDLLAKLEKDIAEVSKKIDALLSLANMESEHEELSKRSRGRVSDPTVSYSGNRFSIANAIRSICENGRLEEREARYSEDASQGRSMRRNGAFYLPLQTRNSDTSNNAGVGTESYSDVLGQLRNRSVAAQCGVRFLTNMQGQVKVPKAGGTTASWVAEGSAASVTNYTTTATTLTPRSLVAYSVVSRQLIKQASVSYDVERLIYDDLIEGIAAAFDRTVFQGSGTGAEPTGAFTAGAGVANVALAGSSVAYVDILSLIRTVQDNNPPGVCRFATSPKGVQTLMGVNKSGSTFPTFLMSDDGKINGYDVLVSKNVPDNLGAGTNKTGVMFGDFTRAITSAWFQGGVEVIVDNVTLAHQSEVRLIAYLDADVAVVDNSTLAYLAI